MAERTLRADAQRNLELILEAASEAFAEGGLEVGVADIARRAGVGTATIFRRFPTKEDLMLAVLELRFEEVMAPLREAAEEPGGLDVLRRVLEQTVEFQICDKGFLESAAKDVLVNHPRVVAARNEFIDLIGKIVSRAQEAGEIRPDVTPEDMPFLLHGLGHAAQMAQGASGDLWRRYLDLLLDGLRPDGARPLGVAPPTRAQVDAVATNEHQRG